MKNIAIVFHDADFDGKLSNEVCRFHLAKLYPESAIHSYGWDYGRPVPKPYEWPLADNGAIAAADWCHYDAIYIVDLSVDELMADPALRSKIVWIDHHRSAIDKWDHIGDVTKLVGYRIDGVAACRLCWQWFTFDKGPHGDPRTHPSDIYTPYKQDFIDRRMMEPELIRLAGEYDIWDHRDSNAKILQFGLRACSEREFRELVQWQFDGRPEGEGLLQNVLGGGKLIKSYMDKQNAEYATQMSGDVFWEGLCFLAINSSHRNSDAFLGAIKERHDALLNWRYDPKSRLATISLYHAPGHEHIDLSKIAVKYGGGGHKGACGFRMLLHDLEAILHGGDK